ncbi:MAG: hypothetical protein AB7H97_04070 [Pseudobdellovibrionaceae bacterium]
MNNTESAYANHLELQKRAGQILWYKFEGIKLRLADKTFYTPDFFVMNEQGELECHEVKGTSRGKPFIEDDAAVKIKVAAENFPFRFRLLWSYQREWLQKSFDDADAEKAIGA